MTKEVRHCHAELRANKENRHLVGYAAVFNSRSEDLGGFVEVIDPAAFDGVIDKSDVFAVLDHDLRRGCLARSKRGAGTLSLSVDEKGLRYEFDAPATPLGDEVLEAVRRGDITASSFCFSTEDDHWERQADGTYLRTILRVAELYDVSPVYTPAYESTSVSARALLEKRKAADEKELTDYYNNLKYKQL